MRIGDVVLENEVFLAPMAGVTDLAFRLICKEYGSGLLYTAVSYTHLTLPTILLV